MPSFSQLVLRRIQLDDPLVELCCGSNTAVGRSLRKVGFRGRLTFVDWNASNLAAHREAWPVERGARWVRASAFDIDVNPRAWLLVHRTLPRFRGESGLIKPRTSDEGTRLVRELAATGARGAFILAVGVETDVARSAVRSASFQHEVFEDVGWESAVEDGSGRCIALRFPELSSPPDP